MASAAFAAAAILNRYVRLKARRCATEEVAIPLDAMEVIKEAFVE